MFPKAFFTGLTAAILSSAGAVGYAYTFNTNVFDYTNLLDYKSIAAACVFVCIFAAIMFWVAGEVLKSWGEPVFNILFAFGTIAGIYFPLNSTTDDQFGYFVVYALPLHYFPVLAWFAVKPFFYRK